MIKYFLIEEENAEEMETISKLIRERFELIKRNYAVISKFCYKYYHTPRITTTATPGGTKVIGLIFYRKEDIPDGWVWIGQKTYRPKKGCKEYNEMVNLPLIPDYSWVVIDGCEIKYNEYFKELEAKVREDGVYYKPKSKHKEMSYEEYLDGVRYIC